MVIRSIPKRASRRGRPRKLDQETVEKMVQAIGKPNHCPQDGLAMDHFMPNVHPQTIRNHLINEGFCKSLGCSKMWLTIEARSARLAFANAAVQQGVKWHSVLFTAAIDCGLSANGTVKLLDRTRQFFCDQCQREKSNRSCHTLRFWIAVGYNQKKSLTFFRAEDDAIKTLLEVLKIDRPANPLLSNPDQCILLESDELPKEIPTERSTKSLQEMGFSVIQCPPCSFDMNLAQDVLLYIKKSVQKLNINSPDELMIQIKRAWEGVSSHKLNRMVDSVPSRVSRVIQREGRFR
ncbi:hypothetical protein BDV23DRAFT_133287 [Aspergillus alliaceus]|uniref:Tc1-like transposase DDE domain-containing protein n=1 Tax=Petromyces alliaceus TaxID=209559 RepID=A0A5N7BYK0_PETAA|nr:hypothetical protein BDV23DRAFT_133287 [Aspergillus alliaceus]